MTHNVYVGLEAMSNAILESLTYYKREKKNLKFFVNMNNKYFKYKFMFCFEPGKNKLHIEEPTISTVVCKAINGFLFDIHYRFMCMNMV